MNDADSKKLEEVDDLQHYMEATSRLSTKVAEQDREIEWLRSYIDGNDKDAEIDELETRAEKAEAELKDTEYRWQCERERVMKARAEIERWQRKKWEIEEKYNQLFTEYKRRGKTIIRLDNRNKKVEAVLEAFKSGITCEARDRELMLEAQLKDCAIKIKELEEAAK